ncbi:MAG: DoxX family protein [Emcibacter sp.]|nr:DoxX family protein [Emcibacter sp.]
MITQACRMMDKLTSKTNWLQSIALLAARLWIAKTFFMSGLVKIKSWDSTIALFTDEYNVPILSPEIAAYLATIAELSLPVLLVLGFMTPLAAVGLFGMTLVIELFVYPDTTDHYHWMLLLGLIMTFGSGKFGMDYWIAQYFSGKKK